MNLFWGLGREGEGIEYLTQFSTNLLDWLDGSRYRTDFIDGQVSRIDGGSPSHSVELSPEQLTITDTWDFLPDPQAPQFVRLQVDYAP